MVELQHESGIRMVLNTRYVVSVKTIAVADGVYKHIFSLPGRFGGWWGDDESERGWHTLEVISTSLDPFSDHVPCIWNEKEGLSSASWHTGKIRGRRWDEEVKEFIERNGRRKAT